MTEFSRYDSRRNTQSNQRHWARLIRVTSIIGIGPIIAIALSSHTNQVRASHESAATVPTETKVDSTSDICPWGPPQGLPIIQPTTGRGFDRDFSSDDLHEHGLTLPNDNILQLFRAGYLASILSQFKNKMQEEPLLINPTQRQRRSALPLGNYSLPLATTTDKTTRTSHVVYNLILQHPEGDIHPARAVLTYAEMNLTPGTQAQTTPLMTTDLCSQQELEAFLREGLITHLLTHELFRNLAVAYIRLKVAEEKINAKIKALHEQLTKEDIVSQMDNADPWLTAWINAAICDTFTRVARSARNTVQSQPDTHQAAFHLDPSMFEGIAESSKARTSSFLHELIPMALPSPEEIVEKYRATIMPTLKASAFKTPVLD